MKWHEKFLKEEERIDIRKSMSEFEKETQSELTITVVKSSDPYPAAVLRFALYSSVILTMGISYFFSLPEAYMWPLMVFLLTLPLSFLGGFPSIKKWMLADIEVNREVSEKAIEVFYQHAKDKTQHQSNVLIYLSLLERKLLLMVDENLKSQIPQESLNLYAKELEGHLKQGENKQGLLTVIRELSAKVQKKTEGSELPSIDNELADRILFLDFSH